MTEKDNQIDPEFDAMQKVYPALKDLDTAAQNRVLDYVLRRLSISRDDLIADRSGSSFSPRELAEEVRQSPEKVAEAAIENEEQFEGVSPVAQKWIRRNGLTVDQLSELFSLGLDQIELLTKTVSGSSKRQKMRNVILLTGVAGYLSTGAPRVTYPSLKEALSHYNAFDTANFATYLKEFASEVSGSKEAGFTLTARGLAAAAELITTMASKK